MKKVLIFLIITLTNIACSGDEDIDPILITINNSVWTNNKNVGQNYFQDIKEGKQEGVYILFLNGQIDLKYYFEGCTTCRNITGIYEYKSTLVRMEMDDGRVIQYKVLGNEMELITTDALLDVEEKEKFPTYLYLL